MLNINLNLYRIFLVVADSKSLTDASNKLNISVPAISKSIKQLEEYLGTMLFYRENGMRLTVSGKEFYDYISEGFIFIDKGEKLLLQKNDISNGEIIIGCPAHIAKLFLMQYIEKVNIDYPNLRIKIYSGTDGLELLSLLNEHKIDFIIDCAQINIESKDCVYEKIKNIEYIFVSKKTLKIEDIKELEKLTYILPFEYTATTKELVDCFKKHNLSIEVKKQIDVTEIRVELAKRNIGVAYVMKEAVKDELERKELYQVKLPFELPNSTMNLIYLKGQLTKVDKEFINNYLKK